MRRSFPFVWKIRRGTVLSDQPLVGHGGDADALDAAGNGVGAALGQVARFASEVELTFVSPPQTL